MKTKKLTSSQLAAIARSVEKVLDKHFGNLPMAMKGIFINEVTDECVQECGWERNPIIKLAEAIAYE